MKIIMKPLAFRLGSLKELFGKGKIVKRRNIKNDASTSLQL